MAEKLNDSETVSFDELLLANTIQIDALSQLLIEGRIRVGKWASVWLGDIPALKKQRLIFQRSK